MPNNNEGNLRRAAATIAAADALLIGAGAGMGVDSGLPDFRGSEGFWRAYPPYAKLGLSFAEIANPEHFATDPAFGWGFYGHRGNLYRRTRPHEGFAILRRWAGGMAHGPAVFTSNVDDHFHKAGFDADRIAEVHGSIERRQCLAGCGVGIFPAGEGEVAIDPETFRAVGDLPACPACGGLARPNILMFGDWGYDSSRGDDQMERLRGWLEGLGDARLAVIEFGAGRGIPTVRRFSEQVAGALGATLIRVNPREPDVPAGHVSLPMGALEAIRAIDDRLPGSGGQGLGGG